MSKGKLKIKNEKVLQIAMTNELFNKIKKHADKHNNGVMSKTGRDAIEKYL